jgi:hypothetical protein
MIGKEKTRRRKIKRHKGERENGRRVRKRERKWEKEEVRNENVFCGKRENGIGKK